MRRAYSAAWASSASRPEEIQFAGQSDGGALAGDHAPRHGEEDQQPDAQPEPAADFHAAFRNTRNRALLARTLSVCSVWLGTIGLRVMTSPSGRPRQVHTGNVGGQTQVMAHSRKACFTIRSSPE